MGIDRLLQPRLGCQLVPGWSPERVAGLGKRLEGSENQTPLTFRLKCSVRNFCL